MANKREKADVRAMLSELREKIPGAFDDWEKVMRRFIAAGNCADARMILGGISRRIKKIFDDAKRPATPLRAQRVINRVREAIEQCLTKNRGTTKRELRPSGFVEADEALMKKVRTEVAKILQKE